MQVSNLTGSHPTVLVVDYIAISCCYSCRSAQKASSYYRLERVCQCKKISCWRCCSFYLVLIPSLYLIFLSCIYISWFLWIFPLCLLMRSISLGMKRINFFWESDEQCVHQLWCHLLYYRVIACTLDFLLLQPMLQLLIVASQYSTTQGEKKICCISF